MTEFTDFNWKIKVLEIKLSCFKSDKVMNQGTIIKILSFKNYRK